MGEREGGMERGEEERERGRKGAREGRERTYLLDIQTREKEKMKACGEAVGGVKPRSSLCTAAQIRTLAHSRQREP